MKERTMPDPFTERLSAYLDDELSAADRRELEVHLAECATCRSDLDRLRQVTQWAATYAGTPTRADVWHGVREEIRQRVSPDVTPIEAVQGRERMRVSVPLALAASLAFFAVGIGGWVAGRAMAPTPVAGVAATAEAMMVSRPTGTALLAAEKYGAAIAQLEQALLHGEDRLDSATVRVVVQKLAVIDRAISEARVAMAKDPGSAYLAEHFATMMRRKLTLLRSAAAVRSS
jgi:anti-sigma factor RsiW